MDFVIEFPRVLDVAICEEILLKCSHLSSSYNNKITIDLSKVRFIRPFGVTYLSCLIYDMLLKQNQVSLRRPNSTNVDKYLADIRL